MLDLDWLMVELYFQKIKKIALSSVLCAHLLFKLVFGIIPFLVSFFLTGVGCLTGRKKKEVRIGTRRSCNCKAFCTCGGGEKGRRNKNGLDVVIQNVLKYFINVFVEHVAC